MTAITISTTGNRITVRQAVAADAAAISALYLQFLSSYGHHGADRDTVARFIARVLALPWVHFFVAVDASSKIVGFAGCTLTYSAVSQALAITIEDMFVDALVRRHGIATALCGAIEAHARRNGFVKIFLESAPEAVAANALYRKFGFEAKPYLAMAKDLQNV